MRAAAKILQCQGNAPTGTPPIHVMLELLADSWLQSDWQVGDDVILDITRPGYGQPIRLADRGEMLRAFERAVLDPIPVANMADLNVHPQAFAQLSETIRATVAQTQKLIWARFTGVPPQ